MIIIVSMFSENDVFSRPLGLCRVGNRSELVFAAPVRVAWKDVPNAPDFRVANDGGAVYYRMHNNENQPLLERDDGRTTTAVGLTVSGLLNPCGSMEPEDYNLRLGGDKLVKARLAVAYDYRALSFALGWRAAHLAFDVNNQVARIICRPPRVQLVEMRSDTTEDYFGMPVINRAVAPTSTDFWTLVMMFKELGVNKVAHTYSHTEQNARVHTGESLFEFCVRLQSIIVGNAKSANCAPNHIAAYMRGMSLAVSLHAHSDEGGYVRSILKHAHYPYPLGVNGIVSQVYENIPVYESNAVYTRRSVPVARLREHVVTVILRTAALATAADPGAADNYEWAKLRDVNNRPVNPSLPFITVSTKSLYQNRTAFHALEPEGGILNVGANSPSRPSQWLHLKAATETWHINFLTKIKSFYDIENTFPSEWGAWNSIFRYDRPDRHLTVNTDDNEDPILCPFFWVEPSGIGSGITYPYKVFVDDKTTTPMVDCEQVICGTSYNVMKSGRPRDGSSFITQLRVGSTFRDHGMMTAFAMAINLDDGLAYSAMLKNRHTGSNGLTLTRNPSTCIQDAEGNVTMSQLRWLTYDNPLPHPLSGLCVESKCYMVTKYPHWKDVRLPTAEAIKMDVSIELGKLVWVARMPSITAGTRRRYAINMDGEVTRNASSNEHLLNNVYPNRLMRSAEWRLNKTIKKNVFGTDGYFHNIYGFVDEDMHDVLFGDNGADIVDITETAEHMENAQMLFETESERIDTRHVSNKSSLDLTNVRNRTHNLNVDAETSIMRVRPVSQGIRRKEDTSSHNEQMICAQETVAQAMEDNIVRSDSEEEETKSERFIEEKDDDVDVDLTTEILRYVLTGQGSADVLPAEGHPPRAKKGRQLKEAVSQSSKKPAADEPKK